MYTNVIVTLFTVLVFLGIVLDSRRQRLKRRYRERLWRRFKRQRQRELEIEAIERRALIRVLHERTQRASIN